MVKPFYLTCGLNRAIVPGYAKCTLYIRGRVSVLRPSNLDKGRIEQAVAVDDAQDVDCRSGNTEDRAVRTIEQMAIGRVAGTWGG